MMRPSFSGLGLFQTTLLLAVVALGLALAGAAWRAHALHALLQAREALTVQVISPATPEGVALATARLRGAEGVISADPMDAARAARLLEQAGGAPVDPAGLPPLHLIEVRRAVDADARIAAALRDAGVKAAFYPATPADPDAERRAMVMLNAALAAAALILLAVAQVFAAAASARGTPAALAADLGGNRADALAHYGRSAWEYAFPAGVAAAILCTSGACAVLMALDDTLSIRDMATQFSSLETAFVFLAPVLTAATATLGSRAGAARAYDRADRLR